MNPSSAEDPEPGIGLALFHRLAVRLAIEGAVLHDFAELGGPEPHRGEVGRCPGFCRPMRRLWRDPTTGARRPLIPRRPLRCRSRRPMHRREEPYAHLGCLTGVRFATWEKDMRSLLGSGCVAVMLLSAAPSHAQVDVGSGLVGAGVGAAIGGIAGGGRGAATG